MIPGLFIGAGMRSRRLLPGDVVSVAFGIKDNGQVVGLNLAKPEISAK